MFEHFTEGARAALMQAHAEARARSDGHVGVEHLLVGMLPDGTGVAASILAEASVTPEAAVTTRLSARMRLPLSSGASASVAAVG